MAERYWEHKKPRRHHYVDGDTGKILGYLYERLTDGVFTAHVTLTHGIDIGDYVRLDDAQRAVAARVTIEEAAEAARQSAAAVKAITQADGESA